MTNMKKVSLAISAAALAIGGIAYAQMSNDHPKFDADGDGVVTRAEQQTAATAMFARLDVNKDGKLDQTDRDARHEQMRTEMFGRMDADNNGSISKDEFMKGKPGREGHGKHMGGPGMGMDDAGGHRMHGRQGMHGGHRGGMKMMKMADANNDGSVSQAEFTAAANKRFDMVDANKDGKITKEERDAAHQKMKEAWKARKAQATDSSK